MRQLRLGGVEAPKSARVGIRVGGEAFGTDGSPKIAHRKPAKLSPDEEALERLAKLMEEIRTFIAEAEAEAMPSDEAWKKVFVSATSAGERYLSLPEHVRAELQRNGWAQAPTPVDDPSGGLIVGMWLVRTVGSARR